jgi:hypothetical protein
MTGLVYMTGSAPIYYRISATADIRIKAVFTHYTHMLSNQATQKPNRRIDIKDTNIKNSAVVKYYGEEVW